MENKMDRHEISNGIVNAVVKLIVFYFGYIILMGFLALLFGISIGIYAGSHQQ